MFSFNFRGKNSFRDFGIIIEKKPHIPMPQRNVENIKIPGRSGAISIDYNTYDDITIPIECNLISDEMKNRATQIKHWLMGSQDKLILSDETYKFYIAQVVNRFDITQSIRILGTFPVIFNCKPFAYYFSGLETITVTSPTTIYSPEFVVKSEPKITVYGQGDITLNINNNSIKLKDVQDYIVVDSTIQECYKDNSNCNNKMCGEFSLLIEENTIGWEGNVSKIEIIPNWRCL
ncbi:distal tail protein Dit [Clostridium botulinum]|uniref:distal tail protein Dit n=1 Tax=Clostridium botulinum TaxID=1491 RepID=UPI0004D347FA|nr:distal tail protein Dit [Clostridium botulinum]KEI01562.1 phage tail component [Clostridium botulinum C/D str. BKT75002]KEI07896.1 phage tail component [Clostridium botulinum C/D str. BKT2873]QPW61577.1 phage tail family protein [Clostridium botulinum]